MITLLHETQERIRKEEEDWEEAMREVDKEERKKKKKKPTIDDMYSSVGMSDRTKENTETHTTFFEPERGPLDILIIEVFRKIYKIKTKVENKLCFSTIE